MKMRQWTRQWEFELLLRKMRRCPLYLYVTVAVRPSHQPRLCTAQRRTIIDGADRPRRIADDDGRARRPPPSQVAGPCTQAEHSGWWWLHVLAVRVSPWPQLAANGLRQHMCSASSATSPGRRKGSHACCLGCSASMPLPLTDYLYEQVPSLGW